jgi:predicted Fe-Mo cluster-binding NifX family protein
MKIALPVAQGELALHFGHCEQFVIFEIEDNAVKNTTSVNPPAHEPGALPRFLHAQGVDCIIAGGMGSRAQQLFAQNEIKVVTGASGKPEDIVKQYLADALKTGGNLCDH